MAKAVAQVQLMTIKTQRAINTSFSEALGLKTVLYTFRAIIVEAESIEESVEDITAALIAPRPKKATHVGVKYCKHKGNTNEVLPSSSLGLLPKRVASQFVLEAIAPKRTFKYQKLREKLHNIKNPKF